MRLLVTGGAGFIGSHIVDAALARGWSVRVVDSLDPDLHPRPPLFDPQVEFVIGDVTDAATVDSALQGIDTVCHQSAKVGLGVSFADAPDYIRNNDYATAILLAAMERRSITRLVLASSMVVYGEGAYTDSETGLPARPGPRAEADLRAGIYDPRNPETGDVLVPAMVTEEAPLDPRNVYAASKVSQEHLAAAWARSTGSAAVALRYHNVYGPRMPRPGIRPTPVSLPCSARPWPGVRRRGSSKTAPSGAASFTSGMSPPRTSPQSTRSPPEEALAFVPITSVRTRYGRSVTWPRH